MSALAENTVKSLILALTDAGRGNEVAVKLNQIDVLAGLTTRTIAATIIATNVSQTIDFGSLIVGDHVVIVPAAAGNAQFVTIATAGTLGQAAVVGSLYVVLRTARPVAAVTSSVVL